MCDNWVSSIGAAVYRQDGQALVQLCGCLNPTDGTWRPIPPFVAAGQAGQVPRQPFAFLLVYRFHFFVPAHYSDLKRFSPSSHASNTSFATPCHCLYLATSSANPLHWISLFTLFGISLQGGSPSGYRTRWEMGGFHHRNERVPGRHPFEGLGWRVSGPGSGVPASGGTAQRRGNELAPPAPAPGLVAPL